MSADTRTMSLTLGEKLRQARDERGFTLSEVAEQTRISALYLQSIENDDYRPLPGGIFNKGFVKSYAKLVGINEQEALMDYLAILAESEIVETELKVYKPEVLTDDRSGPSMIPTVVTAVIILGLMSVGIWFLVGYLRPPSDPVALNTPQRTNANSNGESPANINGEIPSNVPEMATLKVEFKAMGQPVRLIATTDGAKSDNVVAAGSVATFEPKNSLTLNYNRWNAQAVQLTINGKSITLPATPLSSSTDKGRIEFTISKETLAKIWTSGAILDEASTVTPIDANLNTNTAAMALPAQGNTTPAPVKATPTPGAASKPPVNSNTVAKPTPAATPAPTRPSPKPPANGTL